MNKTTLFLVRHGQTKWNTEGRLQGHKNAPLTQLGINQSLNARKSLSQFMIDKAYVSPLKRARETLNIIVDDRAIETVVSNKLKEINLGPWEGKTREETKLFFPEEYQQFWNDQDKFYLSGAETYQQLQQRVVEGLNEIFTQEKGNTILVVSHWIAIKVAIAFYSSVPLSRLSTISDPENGKIICLTLQDKNISVDLL